MKKKVVLIKNVELEPHGNMMRTTLWEKGTIMTESLDIEGYFYNSDISTTSIELYKEDYMPIDVNNT